MADRVENASLLAAGMKLMAAAGKPLIKVNTGNRSMVYRMTSGESVRVRTCNDHILVVIATASEAGPVLNIEGTDYLLFVLPQVERTKGNIEAYLLPTSAVVKSVKSAYAETLSRIENLQIQATTCNLWLDEGKGAAFGCRSRWASYRLTGTVSTESSAREVPAHKSPTQLTLATAIETAKEQIARAAGIPIDRIKITVEVLF